MKPVQTQLLLAYNEITNLEYEIVVMEGKEKELKENNQLGVAKETHKACLKKGKALRKLLKELDPLERAVAGLDPPEELSDDEALVLSKVGEVLTPDAEDTKLWGVRAGDVPVWLQGKVMIFALACMGLYEDQIKVLKEETETISDE